MAHRRETRPTFALLAAATLLAVGCKKLPHTLIEDLIKQDLAQKGHRVKSVTCPEDRDFKEDTFECDGKDSAGKAIVFKVTIRPIEGGKADVKYTGTVDGRLFGN